MIDRKKKGKLKQGNSGFSFIELIVVIAILAMMVSVAAFGVSLIVNADSKKAAKNLYQEISSLRNETLAQTGTWYGEISRTSAKGQYMFHVYRQDAEGNTKMVSKQALGSKITIVAKGAAETTITPASPVRIYFNQGSGTVKSIQHGNSGDNLCDASNRFYLNVTSNNGEAYNLTIWLNTGKISTDY